MIVYAIAAHVPACGHFGSGQRKRSFVNNANMDSCHLQCTVCRTLVS